MNMTEDYRCIASMVVYKNPRSMVREAARSFLQERLKTKIYVIDNSPSAELSTAFDGLAVSYHFSGRNEGYGRGNNRALALAESGRYFLIMNPDITISNGTVEKLASYMDENPDIGILGPMVLNTDGTLQRLNRREPTVAVLFFRRFLPRALSWLVRKKLDLYEMEDAGYDSVCDVPFISGAFMFCRTAVLKEVGGFDPRYFMYFEDADISRKVRSKGYRTVYYPYANVVHGYEKAAHKSLKMAFVFIMNGIRYFNKWGWALF
ncbi:MAG: glycosyltransferase family 2 protein [Deltaproteobacteria bacterium]|nr:glycosyltransferase family 2 protein [Deltaproteobacteria bacterium]